MISNIGFPPRVYTHAEVENGRPVADGITVLVVARVATLRNVSSAYVAGIRSFIGSGGSVLGEYDGAALFFDRFSGGHSIIPRLTPSFRLFSGAVTGGGALLPLENSRLYVTDPGHPIMQGMPESFHLGVRAAFALTDFDGEWLHVPGTFDAAGSGFMPPGTYPAVVAGRCGGGRVALSLMNQLQVADQHPASLMFTNALRWLVGQ
ncbi:MAG: hypothetical protein ACREQ9_07945 [Candidatus Binatia bacterium]